MLLEISSTARVQFGNITLTYQPTLLLLRPGTGQELDETEADQQHDRELHRRDARSVVVEEGRGEGFGGDAEHPENRRPEHV